jgi:hypothetical protein
MNNTETPRLGCRVAGYLGEPAEIDSVVEQLHALETKIGLDRCIAIGGLILQRFFGGSPQIWRARSRNKNNSVRRIAQHPSCPLSKSSLSEAIGVHVVVQELPFVRTSGHIGASHVAAVLRLSLDEQRSWLERAEVEHWSVRELRAEIQMHRTKVTPEPQRPRLHASVVSLRRAVRAFDRAVRAIQNAEELTEVDLDKIGELSREMLVLSARLDEIEGSSAQASSRQPMQRNEASAPSRRRHRGLLSYELSRN